MLCKENTGLGQKNRGLGLVDILVGAALVGIVFSGIIGGFRYSLELIALSRGQQGALSIANDQLEIIRSLPYISVGTSGGIPSGSIPQIETITLNNITYTKRVLIQSVDAEEDGLDLADTNGITADYKLARIEVSWSNRGKSFEEVLITNIVPQGIETTGGGGTIRVNVFDATVSAVESAEIRVVNPSTTPPIDVTTFSNTSGTALFSGAPTTSGYQISATKNGYSSAQTYDVTGVNPNPNPGHITVAESQTSSISFAIDQMSTSTILTAAPVVPSTTTDTFPDGSGILAFTQTTLDTGSIRLADDVAGYFTSGEVLSVQISPTDLFEWDQLLWSDTKPGGTDIIYRLYYEDETMTRVLVPDAALPGNAVGFTSSPVDISSVDGLTYNNLYIEASLTTGSTAVTPTVDDWTLIYTVGPSPISNVTYRMHGEKTIGTDAGANPIYKHDQTNTTSVSGTYATSVEWDAYTVSIDGATEGYNIAEVCNPSPFTIAPNTESTTTVTLVPYTNASLHITVEDPTGVLLEDADVRVTRTGYDVTQQSSSCGQTFFGGLSDTLDYDVETSLSGYTTDNQTVTIDGSTSIVVSLNP